MLALRRGNVVSVSGQDAGAGGSLSCRDNLQGVSSQYRFYMAIVVNEQPHPLPNVVSACNPHLMTSRNLGSPDRQGCRYTEPACSIIQRPYGTIAACSFRMICVEIAVISSSTDCSGSLS